MNSKVKIKDYFAFLPAGVSGVGLGIAGLANAWNAFLTCSLFTSLNSIALKYVGFAIQTLLIIITIICFCLILFKIIFHFNVFKKELKDVLTSSYLPTEAMCLSCIGYYVGVVSLLNVNEILPNQIYLSFGTILASILILLSLLIHTILLIYFLKNVLFKQLFRNTNAYFSWLIPICGIGLSCGFYGKLGNLLPNEFLQVFWYFAFISLIIVTPIILYKHFLYKIIEDSAIASIAISFAAPNLVLNGMLALFTSTSYYSISVIIAIAIVIEFLGFMGMFLYYCAFIKSFKISFNGGYAAFTFPASISTLATIKLSDFIFNNMNGNTILLGSYYLLIALGIIFLINATWIIWYIFFRYILLLTKILKNAKLNFSSCISN